MAASVFSLLLFVQLSRLFASGIEVKSTICGTDHIAYSNSDSHEVFYLNDIPVDRVLFCKVLQLHYEDHSVLEGYTGADSGFGVSLADFSTGRGRKLLHEPKKDEIPDDNPEGNNNRKLPVSTKVGMAAASGVLLTCVLICPCLYRKKKATDQNVLSKDVNTIDLAGPSEMSARSLHEKVPASPLWVPPTPSRFSTSQSPQLNRIGSVHLSMTQVTKATHNFSPALKIGEGGFGAVYKAQLDSGQVVAIKRAKKEHFENLETKFSSEVELLSKIDHRNLVKLLGYIDKGNERLIITEYAPNGTLKDHLDGQLGKILNFNQRLEIAIDVAHGLTYLHLYAEKQIIHRDVKSSNILLTESMRAKVADFGFAIVGPMDSDRTHISTKVKGTVGYLDPEYMRTYQLTTKSDVYSFGVLLVEILTGRRPVELRRPVEERVTPKWAFQKYNEGQVVELVDPKMEEVVDAEILRKMFALAFQCAAPIRNDRPEMKSVGEQLWAIRADYVKTSRRG
ncbi:Calmodulin-binding receptor-like cytoplasmic kinase 3 [Hibiscus syriacus]|uniref:non-specific serine/threonine protein kinase n=1 Tax=Hibiscus syriacus TaxID=106335 RepID=A0A6A2Y2Y3_HIBSY|nr:calmodulin-binding receptor-like cytoplasmic kinase 3 [Hibiscus syriacus]KAE8664327.1 Calmodulin-binding receptor-like cytoplasmic kinase 3 [Hibiscus syriacus]